MQFRVEHQFLAQPRVVLAAMVDPTLYRELSLPDLSTPEVVEHDARHLQLRYTYLGRLDPIARRVLGGGPVRWVQQVVIEEAGTTGRLTFASEDRPPRLRGAATIACTPSGEGTVRRIEGELSVAVLFVAARAEQTIAAGFLRRLDLEADAIRAWLGPQ